MSKNYNIDKKVQNNPILRSSVKLVFKKDAIVISEGVFLGIEEFIEGMETYNYSATVTSEKAKLYEISLKVN